MKKQSSLIESAARLQNALRAAGIESVVIGGIAVAVWGEPRATKDADLKVLLQREQAGRLIASLPPEYKPDASAPEDELRQKGFIFTLDENNIRVDLLLAETSFDLQAVARGQDLELLPGINLVICTAEDLIIYKMISTRPRDQADLPGIIRRQRKVLDHNYLLQWLHEFEIAFDDSTLVRSYRQLVGLET